MSEPLTIEELDAIEKRCDAASPGPWEFRRGPRPHQRCRFHPVGGDTSPGDAYEPDMYLLRRDSAPASVHDQDFVAHARQDVPRLVAEVRRLQALLGHA
jgi:hypothetical protein